MASEMAVQRKNSLTLYGEALAALSPGLLVGLLCGALIGGAGGRLAMLLLRITSDDSVRGLESDDGFTIGAFTGDTLFLVGATTFLGGLGGLAYMAVRGWLPARWRALLFGTLAAALGGFLVIRPEGVDFTLLAPVPLAVGLFIALPGAYGASLSLLTEKLVGSVDFKRSHWRWVAAAFLAPAIFTGPPGVVLVLGFLILAPQNRDGRVSRFWQSPQVTWAGRLVFAAALTASSAFLVSDVLAVL